MQKFFEAFSRGEWTPLRADTDQKWTWEEHFKALVHGGCGVASAISWSDSMDFTEKLCEALGCMPTRADAVQLLRRVIGHFKEGKLLPFIHKDNDTMLATNGTARALARCSMRNSWSAGCARAMP